MWLIKSFILQCWYDMLQTQGTFLMPIIFKNSLIIYLYLYIYCYIIKKQKVSIKYFKIVTKNQKIFIYITIWKKMAA